MKLQRFMAGLMAMSMVVLIACGGIAATDSYIVASDIPWAPFEMVTADGEFFGFDLDVMRAIAVLSDFEIEIRNIAFDAIIQTVDSGKADIGASGFTITEEREQTVDFSKPYYLSNQAVVIRKDSGLNIVTAMSGLGPKGAVGAQNGTTGFYWVEDNLQAKGVDVEIKGYEFYPTAILDVVNKRIDAVIQDEPASKASLAAYPDDLTIAGIINTYEYFGFLVATGDPEGILPKVDAAIEELGLHRVATPTEKYELAVKAGSAWDNLLKAYFGPPSDKVEAAWLKSKDLLLSAETLEDIETFAEAFATEANK
jgi:polar amino acid transport system substrate-binding protein